MILSATIGAAAWTVSGDPTTCAVAVVAGVLPDVDHLADYMYFRFRRGHRLILPLHGYEYAVLGIVSSLSSDDPIVLVATLSYLVHLFADQLENRTRPPAYWLLFRLWHRFRVESISAAPEAAMRGRVDDMRRIQKWWMHRVRRS